MSINSMLRLDTTLDYTRWVTEYHKLIAFKYVLYEIDKGESSKHFKQFKIKPIHVMCCVNEEVNKYGRLYYKKGNSDEKQQDYLNSYILVCMWSYAKNNNLFS